jgi:hypothetical protein
MQLYFNTTSIDSYLIVSSLDLLDANLVESTQKKLYKFIE